MREPWVWIPVLLAVGGFLALLWIQGNALTKVTEEQEDE